MAKIQPKMKQYRDGMSMSLSLETPERTNEENDMNDGVVNIKTSKVGRLRIRSVPEMALCRLPMITTISFVRPTVLELHSLRGGSSKSLGTEWSLK